MRNERNAGRKSRLSTNQLKLIIDRVDSGERISSIAQEYGISRQALYKRLKEYANNLNSTFAIDYIINGKCTTRIEVDFHSERIGITNYTHRLSETAFGANSCPDWNSFIDLMERLVLYRGGMGDNLSRFYINDNRNEGVTIKDICLLTKDATARIEIERLVNEEFTRFEFNRGELLYSRTDTDGYQLKAISRDRKYFVKSQAIIGGVSMDDWAVEVIASDICNQLLIPNVKQFPCELIYGGRTYKAVYSKNFQLDGYAFVSFESLIERQGFTTRDDDFIHMATMDKLRWCAAQLSKLGNIPYEDTEKYMLDLALIDCLVGNVNRHTRNFGLFFDSHTNSYTLPMIFDNGMGLFQHDSYRDRYTSYENAMNNVYIAPYGEDPFDMAQLLLKEYPMHTIYQNLRHLVYPQHQLGGFVDEYIERMISIWQK